MAEFVSLAAQSMGFDVRTAVHSKAFMGLYKENLPSVIVMDVAIPDMAA